MPVSFWCKKPVTFSIACILRLREEIKEKHKVNTMNNLAISKAQENIFFPFPLPIYTLLSTKITNQSLTSRNVSSLRLKDSMLILQTIWMTGLHNWRRCKWQAIMQKLIICVFLWLLVKILIIKQYQALQKMLAGHFRFEPTKAGMLNDGDHLQALCASPEHDTRCMHCIHFNNVTFHLIHSMTTTLGLTPSELPLIEATGCMATMSSSKALLKIKFCHQWYVSLDNLAV